MLMLSRKLEESVMVKTPQGQWIEVKIHKASRGRISVGIEAPSDFLILRKELCVGDMDKLERRTKR